MSDDKVVEGIKKAIEKVRPHLQMDGGDVKYVSFDAKKGVVKVKLEGACVGCPMSQMTLQDGVGQAVKAEVPEVKELVAV